MTRVKFSPWLQWLARNDHTGAEHPGVYVIARAEVPLTGKRFSWRREIIYVGMTNSVGGLRARLQQFDNTISGKRNQHGGADRVRYRFPNYKRLSRRLYVAVAAFTCDVESLAPTDLRTMGRVTQYEYECLAAFAQRFKCIPRFNDKKRAPKYSHTTARGKRRSGAA